MSTPSDSPLSPTPPPAVPAPAAEAPKPAAPKPAFKVTRSPFAPKLGGAAAGPAPMSISGNAILSSAAPSPSAARPPKAAPVKAAASASDKPGVLGFGMDVIAAAVAVSFAIMFALSYFAA